MKKKSRIIGISIGIYAAILTGCNGKTEEVITSIEPAISATMTAEKTTEHKKTIAVTATPQPTAKATNYSKAMSADDLNKAEQLARNYYKDQTSFQLISIHVAEDDSELYEANSEYQPGNIIIFKTETSHAGEGVYRYITFARKNLEDEFEMLSEGY
ncbi:MAG: hypothetical protein Q4F05_07950 [bacterium]|nr:hypothetical protein [bacterium]